MSKSKATHLGLACRIFHDIDIEDLPSAIRDALLSFQAEISTSQALSDYVIGVI